MNAKARELARKVKEMKGKNKLRDYVIKDLLKNQEGYDDGLAGYLGDVLNGGCINGTVSGLIYYADTRKFYDKYYHEIEDLREEMENETGEPMRVKGDLKNWFAWFAYEETARKIADELGLTI